MSCAGKISNAVAALACAMAIGAIVHFGAPGTARADATDGTATPAHMEPAGVTLASVGRTASGAAARVDEGPSILRPAPEAPLSKPRIPEAPCMIRSAASPEPGAFVRLRVSAICLPDSRVTVQHGGMLFTERTDAHGELDILVPALAERAVFMLTFAGEQMSMAVIDVPDIADYSRVVLQWQGHGGVALHAREAGAAGEMSGEIGTAADPDARVIRLGNPETAAPMMADVFSVPAAMSGPDGEIRLSVELQVTEHICGRQIEARVLRLDEGRRRVAQPLVLSVPGCDAIGDRLVLNNVLEDLKIATR